jgi:hypothetical protein
MYVNSSLVGSLTINGSIFTTPDPLRIGGDWSGEMFTGLIDDVRIYNRALTQTAIQSDMYLAVDPPSGSIPPTAAGPTLAPSQPGTSPSISFADSNFLNVTSISSLLSSSVFDAGHRIHWFWESSTQHLVRRLSSYGLGLEVVLGLPENAHHHLRSPKPGLSGHYQHRSSTLWDSEAVSPFDSLALEAYLNNGELIHWQK